MCNTVSLTHWTTPLSICSVDRYKVKANDSFSSFGKEFREVDFGTKFAKFTG